MEKSYSPKTHLASQNIIQKHEKKVKKQHLYY